jgi:hypothetical protein
VAGLGSKKEKKDHGEYLKTVDSENMRMAGVKRTIWEFCLDRANQFGTIRAIVDHNKLRPYNKTRPIRNFWCEGFLLDAEAIIIVSFNVHHFVTCVGFDESRLWHQVAAQQIEVLV